MLSEALTLAPVSAPTLPVRHKFRLRFQKIGNLRLVSHHDLMHVLERMMRRAEIPFAVSQGFHPQPKMSFASALALGVAGLNEVFELELKEPIEADELLRRLNAAAPEGLAFSSIASQPKRTAALVRRAFYRMELPEDQPLDVLAERIAQFMALPDHWTVRLRPQRRQVNIRPYVFEVTVRREGEAPAEPEPARISTLGKYSHSAGSAGASPSQTSPTSTLEFTLWITPTGAARPDEIVRALGLQPLLEAGAVLERTHLELMDEVPESERSFPDFAAASSAAPPETPNDGTQAEDDRPRSSSPTALLANPLSFET